MQKFLSIPVTNEGHQLVAINGAILVEQASTSTVTIGYNSGTGADLVTITHDAMAAANEDMRNRIQDSIIAALQQSWTNPSYTVSFAGLEDAVGTPVSVTGIALT